VELKCDREPVSVQRPVTTTWGMCFLTCTLGLTHAHAWFVWACICVSQGYGFIRANFIQLLSDSTPVEKHILAHTYASPPGLREIIVYRKKEM